MTKRPSPIGPAGESAKERLARARSGRLVRWKAMAHVAWDMMFHDRLKMLGTLAGVVFAVVLVVQQLGLLAGLLAKNTMMVDHAGADLWILPPNTKSFTSGAAVDASVIPRARAIAGVEVAAPLFVATGNIVLASGSREAAQLFGVEHDAGLGLPWNVVAGDPAWLGLPGAVFLEDTDRERYGGLDIGDEPEMSGTLVRVAGFHWGLMPFGPSYAFADIDFARRVANQPPWKIHYAMVRVSPGADPLAVAGRLQEAFPAASVLTREEFHDAIVSDLLGRQLGVTFGTSTAFGLIVGFVVVALSMFSSVLDRLRELGTLKAIGCTNVELSVLVLVQALLYAVVGTLLGLGLAGTIAGAIRSPRLAVVVPAELVFILLPAMTLLCLMASALPLLRIRSIEPGMVFR
jgi:putative ABC transport system permease protein